MAKLSFEKCKNGTEYLAKVVQALIKEGSDGKVLFRSTQRGPRIHFHNDLENADQVIVQFYRGNYYGEVTDPLVKVALLIRYVDPWNQKKKLELRIGSFRESSLSNPAFDINGLADAVILRMNKVLELFSTFEKPFECIKGVGILQPKRNAVQLSAPSASPFQKTTTYWVCEGCGGYLLKEDDSCRCM